MYQEEGIWGCQSPESLGSETAHHHFHSLPLVKEPRVQPQCWQRNWASLSDIALQTHYSVKKPWAHMLFFSEGLVRLRFSYSLSGKTGRVSGLRYFSLGLLTCWWSVLRDSFGSRCRVPGQHSSADSAYSSKWSACSLQTLGCAYFSCHRSFLCDYF